MPGDGGETVRGAECDQRESAQDLDCFISATQLELSATWSQRLERRGERGAGGRREEISHR